MRLVRGMLRALLAALLVTAYWLVTPSSARADDGELVSVSITGISTPVIDLSKPDQIVELSGTIRNTSNTRIRYLNASFWNANLTLTSSTQLENVLQSAPTSPLGIRTAPDSEESGHVMSLTKENSFNPGDSLNFKVRAKVSELPFKTNNAAYLVGVQIRGLPDSSPRITVGRGRILVTATNQLIQVANVVKLTAKPSRAVTGDFLNDSLSLALAGPLEELLKAAERPGTTLLLDPSLLLEAQALSQPHTRGGQNQPANPKAADWVKRVMALVEAGRALQLPYGNPDLAAAFKAGQLAKVMGWSETAAKANPLTDLGLAVDLGQFGSQELVTELKRLGVRRVFASNTSGDSTVVPTSSVTDPGMGPGNRLTQPQQISRGLAAGMLAQQPLTYLIQTPAQARLASAKTGWEQLVDIPLGVGNAEFIPATTVPANLTRVLTELNRLVSKSRFLTDLTGINNGAELAQIAAKATSQQFQSPTEALAFLAAQPGLDVDAGLVSLSATKQLVMGSRTNNFPVTITNGLSYPVTVRVVFDSESPQRISVPPSEFVTLQASETKTLNITPEASSNSVVVVAAQLETKGGHRFGPKVPIEITATDLGRVGWIIIIVSGAVVLGGTFLRIRAVQAEHAKEDRASTGK